MKKIIGSVTLGIVLVAVLGIATFFSNRNQVNADQSLIVPIQIDSNKLYSEESTEQVDQVNQIESKDANNQNGIIPDFSNVDPNTRVFQDPQSGVYFLGNGSFKVTDHSGKIIRIIDPIKDGYEVTTVGELMSKYNKK